MIEKDTNLYSAIENAIYAIFEGEIPLEDPMETTEIFISNVEKEMKDLENEDEEG